MAINLPPNTDFAALKAYVTARDDTQYDGLAESIVCVTVTHSNLNRQLLDLRLDLSASVGQLKIKLHRHSGTPPVFQTLVLKRGGTPVAVLDEDERPLGYYNVESGMEIFIRDDDPNSLSRGGGLEDVSQVQKFELTEEEYDQRENTVRNYKREQLARDPNWRPMGAAPRQPAGPVDAETVEGIEVGMRCNVQPGDRRGEVAWVGEIEETGFWVGVRFDEPVGRNDGTKGSTRYFEAQPNFGGFIRGRNLEVGDFPAEDLFASDSDSEDEI